MFSKGPIFIVSLMLVLGGLSGCYKRVEKTERIEPPRVAETQTIIREPAPERNVIIHEDREDPTVVEERRRTTVTEHRY